MTTTERPDESYAGGPNASTDCGPVAIIGLGRAGKALAFEFATAGIPLAGTWNRTQRDRPEALSGVPDYWGGSAPPPELLEQAKVVLLTVADDAIHTLASQLQLAQDTVLLHISGSMPAAVLGAPPPGTRTGSYHPLQSFSNIATPSDPAPSYCVALEGGDEAVATGQALARKTGHPSVVLRPGAKPAYHAAAVLASNGLVALTAAAVRILNSVGIEDDDAWELLQPLVRGTVNNLDHAQPADALTGPIVRGDVSTVARNLRALEDDAGATSIYRALGTEAMRLAAQRGMSAAQLALMANALVAPVERANDD
ncbi:MAG: hypothetical protein CL928_00150 [Deltaproteobacteria bacterium]|nr:hypothetical protein [Deltaproteobacteria bacterium]